MCQMARRQLHQPVAATRICLFNSWLINATTFWLESEALNRKPLDSPVPPVLPALAWATRASESFEGMLKIQLNPLVCSKGH